jgi:hypothetical protein
VEEKRANEGIGGYNYVCRDGSLSQLQQQLEARCKQKSNMDQGTIPLWVNSIDEDTLLDPNAFDPCCCGEADVKLMIQYHNEKEHGYDPAKQDHSRSPLPFGRHHSLLDRWNRRKEGRPDDEELPPRSQTFTQVCSLHAIVSNNIYVMVDTSVENINSR